MAPRKRYAFREDAFGRRTFVEIAPDVEYEDEEDEAEEDETEARAPGPQFLGWTLDEARAFVLEHSVAGVVCPCCDRYGKVYKRSINAAMAVALIRVYWECRVNPPGTWVYIPALPARYFRGGDFAKLRFWGLIERPRDAPMGADGIDLDLLTREDGSDRVGYWRLTECGRQFVEGRTTVPSHAYTRNNVVQRMAVEQITIRDALSTKFSYEALMQAAI